MNRSIWRAAQFLSTALLIAVVGAGCTLTGATEAPPVTPVGTVGVSSITEAPTLEATPTTRPLVIGSPTPVNTIDIFGTLTAQASQAHTGTPGFVAGTFGTPSATSGTPVLGVIGTPTARATGTSSPARTSTPGVAVAGATACPPTYTVLSGDNLFRIALKFNLTVAQLAAANGISNPEFIIVGTVLKIPGCGVTATPTARATATTAGGLQPLDGDTVASNGDILHTVKSGENLFRIALAYNLTWQVVATYNGITSPNAIVAGQVIHIPTK